MTFSQNYSRIKLELLSLKKELQSKNIKLADSKEYGCLKFALHRAKYSKILPLIERKKKLVASGKKNLAITQNSLTEIEKKELFSPKYYQIKSKLFSFKNQIQARNLKVQHSKEYTALRVALHRAKHNVKLKNLSSRIDVGEHFQKQTEINSPVIVKDLVISAEKLKVFEIERSPFVSSLTDKVIVREDLSGLINDVTLGELISTKRALIDESDDLVRRLKAAGQLLPYSKQLQQFVVEIWTVNQIMNLKENKLSFRDADTRNADTRNLEEITALGQRSKNMKVLALVEKMILDRALQLKMLLKRKSR
jgi:hypothetical protein